MLLTASTWLGLAVWVLLITPVSASDLVNAARKNDSGLVVELLRSGADANERGEQTATPLHWAAYHGNGDLVRALLDAGARVNAALENGSTPLHLAAHRGHTEVVRLLLKRGADPSARNREGATPIGWARRNGRTETVKLLASGKADSGVAAPRAERAAQAVNATRTETGVPPQTVAGGYRVQLVAVSSEQRAREVVEDYRLRFEEILRDTRLVFEPVENKQKRLYRVQSESIPAPRARAICEQLKLRRQSCLVRGVSAPGDGSRR